MPNKNRKQEEGLPPVNPLGRTTRPWWVPLRSEINGLNTETAGRGRKLPGCSPVARSSVCDEPGRFLWNCLGRPLRGLAAAIQPESLAHVNQRGRGRHPPIGARHTEQSAKCPAVFAQSNGCMSRKGARHALNTSPGQFPTKGIVRACAARSSRATPNNQAVSGLYRQLRCSTS